MGGSLGQRRAGGDGNGFHAGETPQMSLFRGWSYITIFFCKKSYLDEGGILVSGLQNYLKVSWTVYWRATSTSAALVIQSSLTLAVTQADACLANTDRQSPI